MPPLELDEVVRDASRGFGRTADAGTSGPEDRSGSDRKLVEGARQFLQARKRISGFGPKGLFRDTAWDMMLELFISREEGGVLYVKQLMLASGESTAAAMRRIDRLEDAGFMQRLPDPLDHRRVIVRLTDRGRSGMIAMLREVFDPQAAVRKPVSFTPPVGRQR